MSSEAVSRLNAIRYQAELLATTEAPHGSLPSPGTRIAGGVSSRLASNLVRKSGLDIFISGRSAGAAARAAIHESARQAARSAKLAWQRSQAESVDRLLLEAETVLKAVSIPVPSLTAAGNSERLVRKIGGARRFATPRSKARALVGILDNILSLNPISNDQVPAFVASRHITVGGRGVEIMTNLEKALRSCVGSLLAKTSSDWWSTRVPPHVRARAERYQMKAEAVYPSVSAPGDPLSYVSFADYDDIILDDRNWDDCFRVVFLDRAWISTKLRDLEPIRNAMMHSRDLTEHGLEKLRVVARELIEKLKRT